MCVYYINSLLRFLINGIEAAALSLLLVFSPYWGTISVSAELELWDADTSYQLFISSINLHSMGLLVSSVPEQGAAKDELT